MTSKKDDSDLLDERALRRRRSSFVELDIGGVLNILDENNNNNNINVTTDDDDAQNMSTATDGNSSPDESSIQVEDTQSVENGKHLRRRIEKLFPNLRLHMFNMTSSQPPSPPRLTNGFQIHWQNLSYKVEKNGSSWIFGREHVVKTIVSDVYGYLKSGHLTAIMGPSGAGKSTLLECIAGVRRKGMTGDIFIHGVDEVKIAYIAQKDQLLHVLTVRESMMFASRVKNTQITSEMVRQNRADGVPAVTRENFHDAIVDHLLRQLGLDVCQHTKVAMCSGGQQKRLSVALELVSKPDVILLDEPTSVTHLLAYAT